MDELSRPSLIWHDAVMEYYQNLESCSPVQKMYMPDFFGIMNFFFWNKVTGSTTQNGQSGFCIEDKTLRLVASINIL
jgi:hypothetical protein